MNRLAYATVDGEKIPISGIGEIEVLHELDVETYGIESKECDECGEMQLPTNLVIVASTDSEKAGVYCPSCHGST